MSAFHNSRVDISDKDFFKNILNEVHNSFDDTDATELAVSYAGLSALTMDHQKHKSLNDLKQRIELRYGFRLD